MRLHGRKTALLAAVTLAVAACGGGDDAGGSDGGESAGGESGGELSVWIMQPGNDEVEAIINESVAAFEEANEGVTVALDFVPWASAHDQFVTAIGGGQTPDVAEMGTTWTPEFAELGGLAEVEASADGDYVESLVESATVDGTTYGYPWYAGARGLIYRTDVFEELGLEVPETWDELLAAGETIEAETDLDPIHVAGDYVHMLAPMVWQAGGELAEQDGDTWTGTVDTEPGREAFATYADLFERGWSPNGAISWNSVDVRDAFTNGESAMMIGGGWDLAAILGANPDLEGSVGSAILPEGPSGSRDTFAGGSHLVTFEGADTDLATRFIEFMLEAEQVTTFTEAVGFLPGTVSGIEASAAAGDELYEPFTTQMIEHSRSYPPTAAWGTIEGDKVFTNAIQRVMQGELDVDEAVAEVDAEMDAAFSG
jgi:N,N'-diacetylchitobiose transport system substrate-binding protein